MLKWVEQVKENLKNTRLVEHLSLFRNKFDIFNDTGAQGIESSMAYHAVLTLMVFLLLLCLSSPNFPSRFACFVFDVNQLKVKFADCPFLVIEIVHSITKEVLP